MGITRIPARTDGDLGRTKQDVQPPTDLDTQLAAGEYNALANFVIELAKAVGLESGATPGSLEARVRELGSPVAYTAAFITYDGGHSYDLHPNIAPYVRPGLVDVFSGASVYGYQQGSGAFAVEIAFGDEIPGDALAFVTAADADPSQSSFLGLSLLDPWYMISEFGPQPPEVFQIMIIAAP